MKALFFFLIITFYAHCTVGQGVYPNATVPFPMPVPIPQHSSVISSEKNKSVQSTCDEPARIISFQLPRCLQIDSPVRVSDIATLVFDQKLCATRPVQYSPNVLRPKDSLYEQLVTATVGDSVFFANIFLVPSSQQPKKKSGNFSFEFEAEQFKGLMKSMKNGAVPDCENTGNTIPSGNLSYVAYSKCCHPDNEPLTTQIFSGSYKWNYSITCEQPVYGIPVIPVGIATVIGNAELTVEAKDSNTCQQRELCFAVRGKAGVGGKIKYRPKGIALLELYINTDAVYDSSGCRKLNELNKFHCHRSTVKGKVMAAWGMVSHIYNFDMYKREATQ